MKRSMPIFLVASLVAILVACNGSTGGLGSVPSAVPTASADSGGPDLTPAPSSSTSPSTAPSTEPSDAPGASATPAGTPAETMIVRAYFVLGGEPGSVGLVPVLRVVPKSPAVATAAMNALLAGPTAKEAGDRTMTSAIPDGTGLLGVTIKNGVATVNLTTQFDSGGGTASMQYRLAQVVYTLTQFTTVKSVIFQIEGQTVTVFGSEGIVLDGPVGRAHYYDQLPAIFVDRPAYGAAIGNPAKVSGNADVFEAQFRVAILDASGKTLVDQPAMASCGTGCRGTFSVTLSYTVGKAQYGTLRVYDPSEKDGTPESIRDYPVWLTPAG
jgi:spore germination protein GerM